MVPSPRLQEKNSRGKMVFIAVEDVPVGSKSSAGIGVCISMGERHSFGASAPLSTRASTTNFFNSRRFSNHAEAD